MSKETYYVTTPLYYTNDNLHIGHAYTTVIADALARFRRLQGYDTWFLTGTDEHGQKNERKAAEAGVSPQAYVDRIVEANKALWRLLGISYDDFIRTTEERHKTVVQEIFKRVYDQGDIYKAEYQGLYCTPCETFWLGRQLVDGKCPTCGRDVELVKEESYFFRLSKYADRLLRHIEAHPDFIQPTSRRNEMINFVKQGLEDLCVSRTTLEWGIPVPFDPKHTIYVWFDALSNYITAIGYGRDEDKFRRYWPAQVHLMAKEIVRFHAIIWPIILMALDLPLPERVFGHGWLELDGERISKSKGNIIDPKVLVGKYGLDPVRYYLLREGPINSDTQYSEAGLVQRTNVDLANDLGNLLSRTTAMINKFCQATIPSPVAAADDGVLRELAGQVVGEIERAIDAMQVPEALIAINRLVNRANKYIEETAPWDLAKDPAKADRLNTVLYNLAETLRLAAYALVPFLLEAPEKICRQLGAESDLQAIPWDQGTEWGGLAPGTGIRRGDPIFPRIEEPSDECPASVDVSQATPTETPGAPRTACITYDQFAQAELRIAEVLEAEPVPKADRLLRLKVRLGAEERQIVAGIAQHYRAEELVGRKIVIVANLEPAKIRGVESQGLLLAASAEGHTRILTVDGDIASGARVK